VDEAALEADALSVTSCVPTSASGSPQSRSTGAPRCTELSGAVSVRNPASPERSERSNASMCSERHGAGRDAATPTCADHAAAGGAASPLSAEVTVPTTQAHEPETGGDVKPRAGAQCSPAPPGHLQVSSDALFGTAPGEKANRTSAGAHSLVPCFLAKLVGFIRKHRRGMHACLFSFGNSVQLQEVETPSQAVTYVRPNLILEAKPPATRR
jgi:hypothetical protein